MMPDAIHWNTVTPLLQSGLKMLMNEPLLNPFRLVGGTALSLQMGHRESVDIDLFTDAEYGSIDFQQIDNYLRRTFVYVSPAKLPETLGFGIAYFVGNSAEDAFKLDLYYTDPFIFPVLEIESIRLATKEEIVAMKIDVVQRGGRKKDFWDIHALLDDYTMERMIALHEERYSYAHDAALIKTNITDFTAADEDFKPVCLWGKHWELIKLEIAEIASHL